MLVSAKQLKIHRSSQSLLFVVHCSSDVRFSSILDGWMVGWHLTLSKRSTRNCIHFIFSFRISVFHTQTQQFQFNSLLLPIMWFVISFTIAMNEYHRHTYGYTLYYHRHKCIMTSTEFPFKMRKCSAVKNIHPAQTRFTD